MKNKYVLITVRSNSKRLKNKCFLKLGNITVLEHVISRCIFGELTPIVCTTKNINDRKIIKIAKKLGVKYFTGPEKNKILRWFKCCKKLKINKFHTVDADDPYFDWDAVKKSLSILDKKNCDVVLPSTISRNGAASEGYSFKKSSLVKIIKNYPYIKDIKFDTEMIDNFLDKSFKKKIFRGTQYQKKNIRLTLDYKEDLKLIKKIFLNLGNFCHRKKINTFLDKNKKLIKINYFRNIDWQKKQKYLLEKKLKVSI